MYNDHFEREQIKHYQSLLNRYWYEANHSDSLSSEVRDELVYHLNEAEQALHFYLMYGEEKERIQRYIQTIGDLLTHGTYIEDPTMPQEKKEGQKGWYIWE